jgi:hypothetical protein
MRYQKALTHVRDVVDAANRLAQVEPLTTAAYVYAPMVDFPDHLETTPMAFHVDLSPEKVPWWSEPAACQFFVHSARLDRIPVTAWWRPLQWPVWNHKIVRPVRVWSADGGAYETVLDGLARRDGTALKPAQPTPDEYEAQLHRDLYVSLAHLRRLKDGYFEHPRETDAYDGFSGERSYHLWCAVGGYLDLLDGAREAGIV